MTHQPNDNPIDIDMNPTQTLQLLPTFVSGQPPRRLLDLPVEVLMELALFLECRDFSRFIQTCRSLHNSLDTHYIWHKRFLIRFGQSFLTTKLRELNLVPKSSPSSSSSPSLPASPISPPSPPSPSRVGSPHHSVSTSTFSSTDLEDGYLSSNHSEGESSAHHDVEEDDQDNANQADLKGKDGKIDIRKTNAASKEFLIDLYKQWWKLTIPAESMAIVHMGTRYWEMVDSNASSFGKLAKLNSVWWMVVETIFRGVPPGRYKVQWRLGLSSEAPVVNTDFRVVLFDQYKNDTTELEGAPNDLLFKPKDIQEFTQQTDSLIMNTDRQPFKRLFKGLFTMEMPGELVIKHGYSGVFVQIRNHDGWKSGLRVDYVRLVNLDDPERSMDLLNNTTDWTVVNEKANDRGEEYYPTATSSMSSWFQSLGVNPNMTVNPFTRRTRAVRQFRPVMDPSILEVGARSPTETSATAGTSGTSEPGSFPSTSATSNQLAPNDSHASSSSSSNSSGSNNQAMDAEAEWYQFFAVLFLYCLYVAWTQ